MFGNKEIILNINTIIFSSLDIRNVYQSMSHELSKVIDFDRLSVTLITEKNDLYENYVMSKDYEHTELKEGERYPMEGSLMNKVVQSHRPIIIDDTSKGALITDKILQREGIFSRLGYPLFYKGKIIGSLNFGSKKRRCYSKRHVNFISQIAPQLAMAIENTLLFNKIKEAEEKYRTVIESSPDIIFECSIDGKFSLMNPSVEKITGYPAKLFYEIQGYGLSLCHPDDQEKVKKNLLQIIGGESNAIMDLEFRVLHKQGHTIWLSLEVLPIEQDNTITGIEGFCRDITERKKLDELKDNLIRDVTHELKTPVAKIEMAIDMFERSLLEENEFKLQKSTKTRDILRNNVNRLKSIIKNVLDLSKLESGTETLNYSTFPFTLLATQVINELKEEAERKGNRISCNIPPDVTLHADRERIRQLITQLLDNAIKFTDNGNIRLSSRMVEDDIEIAIEDTGKGLDDEAQPWVFEKFYKEIPAADGSGIGLAICSCIIQMHKGRIWVESEGKGKGSRFMFTLPMSNN